EVNFEEILVEEPDLFKGKEYTFSALLTDKDQNEIELELESLVVEKQSLTLTASEDECDDPGCIMYETEITLTKDGSIYTATGALYVTVDSEDLSPLFEENEGLPRKKLEKLLDEGCKSLYGEEAELSSFVDDYKHSVYCAYSQEIL